MGTIAMNRSITCEPEHLRAICDEVGERLRTMLDQAALPIPDHLLSLIAQLDEPTHWSPSIAPDLDLGSEILRQDDGSTYEPNFSLATLTSA
jgi:hypothetical protein